MTENNTNVISYEQINSILIQLKNSNRIDAHQLSVLQDYYMNHPVYNTVDDIKKLSADISRIAASAKNVNVSNDTAEVKDFDDSYRNDNTEFNKTNQFNNITPNTTSQFNNVNQFNNITSNTTSQFNNVNQFNNTQVNSNENYIQQELFVLKERYPDKIISLTDIPHRYILSQDGIEDIYVNVNGQNGIYQIVNVGASNIDDSGKSEERGISLTKFTAAGKAFADKDNKQAAFTNILFFIFLAGLSVGAISMVVLKFFIK